MLYVYVKVQKLSSNIIFAISYNPNNKNIVFVSSD